MSLQNLRTIELKRDKNRPTLHLESLIEAPDGSDSEEDDFRSINTESHLSPGRLPRAALKMNSPKFPAFSTETPIRTDAVSSPRPPHRRSKARLDSFETLPGLTNTVREPTAGPKTEENEMGIKKTGNGDEEQNMFSSGGSLIKQVFTFSPSNSLEEKKRTLSPMIDDLKNKMDTLNLQTREDETFCKKENLLRKDSRKQVPKSLKEVTEYEKYFMEDKVGETIVPAKESRLGKAGNKETKLLSVLANVANVKTTSPVAKLLYKVLAKVNPMALQGRKKGSKSYRTFLRVLKRYLFNVKEPDSFFIIFWMSLIVIATLVDLFYTPFFLSF